MTDNLKAWLLGTLKSWSMWAGCVMVAFPQWWPLVEPQIREIVSPDQYARLVSIIGIVMIVLRAKTTKSLADKGAPAGSADRPQQEGGFARPGALLLLAILAAALGGCLDSNRVKPAPTHGVPEKIEAAELLMGRISDSLVKLSCTQFDGGRCIEPGKPLMPIDSLTAHARLRTAQRAIARASLVVDGSLVDCLGAERSQEACVDAAGSVLIELEAWLIQQGAQ